MELGENFKLHINAEDAINICYKYSTIKTVASQLDREDKEKLLRFMLQMLAEQKSECNDCF